MTVQSGVAVSRDVDDTPRAVEAPDFLNRIAEELRAKSGSGLPLSCFVEQVKLQLAGGRTPEDLTHQLTGHQGKSTNDCYKAWAMPDHWSEH